MSDAKDRRRKLLDQSPPVLNGIDFVVVVGVAKTTIEVHFMTAAPLAGAPFSATVTGGRTGGAIAITSMHWSLDSFNRPLLTLALVSSGDSAPYTLSLTSAALDVYFNKIRFSFAAGEPSTLDCKAQASVAAPVSDSIPPIDYLAKDFLSFRKALADFSTLRYPAWQERSEADFGVMFMEALCALADDLSYQQDRIAGEAYLATATERLSVLRHACLVDYEPRPALAAHVLLQFSVAAGTPPILAGLAVSAPAPDGSAIDFETGAGLADAGSYRVDARWNEIIPYWWDDSDELLPAGATEMWVRCHDLGLAPGDSLLIDTKPAKIGLPNIREIVRLKLPEETTDDLYGTKITRLPFESPITQSHSLAATTLKGNLVPAIQGLRHSETFAIASGPATVPLAITRTGPNQTLLYLWALKAAPLTWIASSLGDSVRQRPEIVLMQQPASATDAPLDWIWVQTLLKAPAFAPAFTIDPARYVRLPPEVSGDLDHFDYDGASGDTLRFGFDEFGSIPEAGSVFTATYRAGAGAVGNVAADSITKIDPTSPLSSLASAVTNPFPAQGGADAEPVDSIVRLAPYAYQSARFNAVLPEDFVAAAETLPWVGRAGCTFRHTGSWLTAFTAVEPRGADVPSVVQTLALIKLLDRYRLAGFQSYVTPPVYASLDLHVSAVATPDSFDAVVAAAILSALGVTTLPNGASGFFQHGNFAFGQPLERSALEAAIQSAQGVAGISSIRYRRSGTAVPYVEMPKQVKVNVDEIIRVDNNPKKPDAGSIQIVVGGGK